MNVEIQVALNFLIAFLYNKLPRRRVNQFGEELDAALKIKFEGHWYPEKPYKGSAFRCVKTTPPLDPVFEIAAREAGMDISDIQENLPQELSIWIDPGEVSYRMSEKGPVKILYSESDRTGHDCDNSGREVARAFNPEAQCFKPVEVLSNQLIGMSINGHGSLSTSAHPQPTSAPLFANQQPLQTNNFKAPGSSNHNQQMSNVTYTPKSSNPVTFTTAAFAQTKFGSTKLKTNSKRSQRMSPTEFSNYIKQRAILQQQANVSQTPLIPGGHRLSGDGLMMFGSNVSPINSRSISPEQSPLDNFMPMQSSSSGSSLASSVSSSGSLFGASQFNIPSPTSSSPPFSASSAFEATSYLADFLGGGTDNNKFSLVSNGISANHGSSPMAHQHQQQHDNASKQGNNALNRIATFLDHTGPYVTTANHGGSLDFGPTPTSNGQQHPQQVGDQMQGSNNSSAKAAFDNLNMSMNGVTYQNQYQHLLVAN